MKRTLVLWPALGLLAGGAMPARAAQIDVPAGELSERVPILARQAGVSISVASSSLWRTRVRGVRGKLPPGEALALLLDGTSGRAVQLSPTSWRIDEPSRAEARAAVKTAAPHAAKPVQTPAVQEAGEAIIVTAGKLGQRLADFPGTAHVIGGADIEFGGERGMDSILSRLSSLSSTHLGSGRNKLFIRGMADSSFTGPTQATVGQYLGDLRLTYNAPDPDLRLQDFDRVEVLEGSQGTLYGAGSMAGIVRLVPNAPDPSAMSVQASAGLSLTQHGDPGGDMAATVNLPIASRHALRFTAYGLSEGGYIDNPQRGINDINRTRVGGGRANLLLDAGAGWSIDLGGIYQATALDDAQYADRDGPPLTRSSPVKEDSQAQYAMASVVLRKEWEGLRFQSSNAWVKQTVDERFNASAADAPPQLFEQRNRTRMLSSETRLWRPVRDGFGWVLGVSAIDNETEQTRAFEAGVAASAATGASNGVREYTAYGKASYQPVEWLVLGGGGRFTYSRLHGGAQDVAQAVKMAGAAITAEREGREFLPTAEMLAHITDDLALYARYEESFRPGGLAIEGDFVRRFRSDHAQSLEGGARWKLREAGLSGTLSVTRSNWKDIQADFIDGNGFPTTANIGNGRITSIAGTILWAPTPDLTLELGAVYNDSRVVALSPEVARLAMAANLGLPVAGPIGSLAADAVTDANNGRFGPGSTLGRIPNVADYGANGNIAYRIELAEKDLRLYGWFKYLGPSRLGIGPMMGDAQGDYLDTGLVARLGDDRSGLSFTLTNLFDSKGNRFALGTPFETAAGRFITPQRPRTLRIAMDWKL